MPEPTQQEQTMPAPPTREELGGYQESPQEPENEPEQVVVQNKKPQGIALVSAEGICMLLWAVFLDVLGIILNVIPGLGLVSTVLGAMTILPWVWFRGNRGPLRTKIRKFFIRGGISAAAETLSAGILPGWTALVLLNLQIRRK